MPTDTSTPRRGRQPHSQTPWQLSRAELLAGRPLWPDCPSCAQRTDLDAFCSYCDGSVHLSYVESGGIHDWRRYADKCLASLDWHWLGPRVSTMVQAFANALPDHLNRGEGLVLVGGAGCGKTHIAVGLGLLALAYGYSVYAACLEDIFLDIRATFGATTGKGEARLMRKLCTVDLLILDDVGLETPSAWAMDRLAHLVNTRYGERLSTLVTSHLHPARLEQIWGERIASRLYGVCQVVSLAQVADYRSMERAQLANPLDDRWPGTVASVVVKEETADSRDEERGD